MDWVDKPQNYKDFYGILELLRGSRLSSFPLKTFKLGWVAFHSVKVQLKCLDFQCNQYKKLVPVLSRFCNFMCVGSLAAVKYLRYTVLTSSNKSETAVHCCGPVLSVLVMLVSRNVFRVVSILQSIVFSFNSPNSLFSPNFQFFCSL